MTVFACRGAVERVSAGGFRGALCADASVGSPAFRPAQRGGAGEDAQTAEPAQTPEPTPVETENPTQAPAAEPTAAPAKDAVKSTVYHAMGGKPLAQMETLHAQNHDLVAWISIDNVLDLPVVYRDNSYYLTHDFNKNKSTAGTIFLDENHPMTERTQNLLLHGHNMKDGTMFGRLAQYEKNLEYLKAHAFIDFSTLWHQERYVVFAVLDVSLDIGDDRFVEYFAHPTFKSDEEFERYIRRVELASLYAIPMDVKPTDALLTLSTCLDEDRLVILARRQREGEKRRACGKSSTWPSDSEMNAFRQQRRLKALCGPFISKQKGAQKMENGIRFDLEYETMPWAPRGRGGVRHRQHFDPICAE